MRGEVKKWGNSAAVRLPASVMQAADVSLDDKIDVREEGGRIIIEKLRPAEYALDTLVAGITDDNRHDVLDPGGPVGREVW